MPGKKEGGREGRGREGRRREGGGRKAEGKERRGKEREERMGIWTLHFKTSCMYEVHYACTYTHKIIYNICTYMSAYASKQKVK